MKLVGRILLLTITLSFIFLAVGCKSRTPYVGRYKAQVEKPTPKEISLELRADGVGSWTVDSQEVSFRWEVKDSQIWLHTKGGGVIICDPVGDDLFIDLSGDILPEGQRLKFERLPEGG